MKYVEPIKFNSKSIVNNPTVKRKSNKLFWSLFCPVLMILIASALVQDYLILVVHLITSQIF